MILSENRYPLFGIMRWCRNPSMGFRPRSRASTHPTNHTKTLGEACHSRERRGARWCAQTTGWPPLHHMETIMFAKSTKALLAALVLAGASVSFVADASAAPARG